MKKIPKDDTAEREAKAKRIAQLVIDGKLDEARKLRDEKP